MIKRLTITIAASVAMFAGSAQAASAAIDIERPNAQEMEHGAVGPAVEQGVSTSPGVSEPEATESIPAPVDQGISTSPGVGPVIDPSVPESPEATEGEGEEDAAEEEETCGELADRMDFDSNIVDTAWKMHGVFHGFTDDFFEVYDVALKDYGEAAKSAEEKGCYDGGAEALE